MKDPQIGDDVLVIVNPATNNGESIAAGKITKVHEGTEDETKVNVRVFLDTGADRRFTDVTLVDEKPEKLGAHSGVLAFRRR